MNLIDNKRLFALTPVVEGEPNSRESKYPITPVGDIGSLGQYIVIPGYLSNSAHGYKRRLIFQFNVAFSQDFYITNAKQLQQFASMLLLGGCVCIKYRIGNIVYRYKIMDYRNDINWSNFPIYVNQIIKKNFCIEFWQDDYNFSRGITQQFMIKTSSIIMPVDTNQDNEEDGINPPVTIDHDFGIILPWNLPINNNLVAFNDNI